MSEAPVVDDALKLLLSLLDGVVVPDEIVEGVPVVVAAKAAAGVIDLGTVLLLEL